MDQPIQINSDQQIIAVLTEVFEKHKDEPIFGNVHTFCEELNQLVIESGGFFYVFSLKGYSNTSILGFYFNGERWQKAKLPLPDAVYNRIHSRKTEAGKTFAAFLQEAKNLNIKVFNERFLSKWEVHQWLSKRRNLQPFLPKTSLFKERTFKNLLSAYDELYIKPLTGSQGRGIVWVKQTDEQFDISFSNKEKMEHLKFNTQEELIQLLLKKFGKRPFIVQQGIQLLNLKEQRLDFRVLCHRTEEQQWRVTSVVARLSAENHFASNLALGGEVLRPLSALSHFFKNKAAILKLELIKELALEAAACVSDNMTGLTVELGIDIGVDQDGDLWLIEVNSKPSKNTDKKNSRVRPSARAIVEYCNFYLPDRSEGERS